MHTGAVHSIGVDKNGLQQSSDSFKYAPPHEGNYIN